MPLTLADLAAHGELENSHSMPRCTIGRMERRIARAAGAILAGAAAGCGAGEVPRWIDLVSSGERLGSSRGGAAPKFFWTDMQSGLPAQTTSAGCAACR